MEIEEHRRLVNAVLNKNKPSDWTAYLESEARKAYQYEKIMGIRVDGDFPCAKLDWFIKFALDDPQFKSSE